MQYYVVGPDGSRYGPADVSLLRQWVSEGRVFPDTMLEDVASGQRLPATSVNGLFDYPRTVTQTPPGMQPAPGFQGSQPGFQGGQQPGFQSAQPGFNSPYQADPQGYVNYPRQYQTDNGTVWIVLSWVFSSIGLLCCPLVTVLGIGFAYIGATQGSDKARAPKIFGFCILGLEIIFYIFRFWWVFRGPNF